MRHTALFIALILTACGGSPVNNHNSNPCGNGVVDPGEICDGTDFDGQTCEDFGFTGGDLACSDCGVIDTSNCIDIEETCGNGVINPGETCDGTNFGTATCEVLGFSGGVIICTDECQLDTSGCTSCGNNSKEESEVCDGEDFGGQTCTDFGFAEGSLSCSSTCDEIDTANCHTPTLCGNGVCDPSETGTTCPVDCGIVSISGGGYHTCAVRGDGTVWCWGLNDYGQLGNGASTPYESLPVQVAITNAVSVIAGTWHTCLIKIDGTVWCGGRNRYGALGDGTDTDSLTLLQVIGLTAITADTSEAHNCALKPDGTVWCWGRNVAGQLGDGTYLDRFTPVQAHFVTNAQSLVVGNTHTCTVFSTGTIGCWGDNEYGSLGDGTTIHRSTVVPVLNIADALNVTAGYKLSCAGRSNGPPSCWGSNAYGQFGDGTAGSWSSTPVDVLDNLNVLSGAIVSAGCYHVCALATNSTVYCWGRNAYGETGIGSTDPNPVLVPVQVPNLTNVVSVSPGYSHTCVLKNDGTVWCWGGNEYGQMGDGTIIVQHLTPTQVIFPN